MINPEYELKDSITIVRKNAKHSKNIFYISFLVLLCSIGMFLGMFLQGTLMNADLRTLISPAFILLFFVIFTSLYLSIASFLHVRKSIRAREYGNELSIRLQRCKDKEVDNESR
tara:strand:- start:1657 stop:1998 length:342 start_codon:yes stop_codon:yes gene_type:complete